MEPSLIKLDTPEDVQLAYAQGASAIEFIVAKAGHDGLTDIMTRMSKSGTKGASEPIKQCWPVVRGIRDGLEKHLASQQLQEVAG